MGLLGLIAVNLTAFLSGVSLSINFWTIGISSVLGLPGVISMLVMGFVMN